MMYHSGIREQRGRGLGSILGSLMRGFAPIARLGLKAGKSFLQNPLVRQIGNQALEIAGDSAKRFAADLIEGKDVNERAKEELQNARSKIASTLRGGRKRKKHVHVNKIKKHKIRKYSLLN